MITLLRSVFAGLLLAYSLLPLAATAETPAPSQSTTGAEAVHPDILRANAQREKEAERKRYLLLFPLAVVGITATLIVITRRR